MSDILISLPMLANVACMVGLNLGFNAAEVCRFCDPFTLDKRISITFGDEKKMRLPRMRTPQEWALAYDDGAPCFRETRVIEFPMALLAASVDYIERHLTSQLLELIPSGPSGIKTSLELA